MLTLRTACAEVDVVPERGAGLAAFRVQTAAGWADVLRPSSRETADPRFPLASILLLPWSNRVSGGGFAWGGVFHALEPNVSGERFAIHGNGFQLEWTVEHQSGASTTLCVHSDGPGPYVYAARVAYALNGARLRQRLEVTNRGRSTLPFGLGFHPWFRRAADTRLAAPARRIWLEDGDHLPAGWGVPAAVPGCDFHRSELLPRDFVNNLFTGWDGSAQIDWPDAALTARVEAAPPLGGYILYAPSADAGYFCFEPVSHVVDAHNARADFPGDLGPHGGLRPLRTGERLEAAMIIAVGQLRTGACYGFGRSATNQIA